MSRPRKLTEEQLAPVRMSVERRRSLLAQLRAIPTLREYAQQLRCTQRRLRQLFPSS